MAQMNLTPLDDVLDKHFGKVGTQLGERIGVKRAQISRLERGYSITIPTMRRVFKALGVVTATIDLGIAGKVALW